jgi:hypothetical protein
MLLTLIQYITLVWLLKSGLTATDNNENRARSYREQVLEEHDYDT